LLIPSFIDKEQAIEIHDDLIAEFGGSLGLRDEGLLESALAQPQASFFGELLHPTIAEQAAAYLFHLCKNHPFIDGNKRAALGVMEAFLILNGYELSASDDEVYSLVLDVAESKIDKTQLIEEIRQSLISTASAGNGDSSSLG
jgi:death-on-curing protein